GQTSRALAIQARTLEFYRQLGIADEIMKEAIVVRDFVFRRAGRVIGKARFGEAGQGMSEFSYVVFLSQDVHERILCDILQKLGVNIERETELLDFSQNNDQVTAKIKTPRGEEQCTAKYIVGADGAHSTTRHALNIEFPGGTYSQVFYVTDVQVK